MHYKIKVAGIPMSLPVCKLDDSTAIAAFILLGDVEHAMTLGTELAKRAPSHDVILTPEAKSITLAHEMSKALGQERYWVARKTSKVYLTNPLKVPVHSITSPYQQFLYLGQEGVAALKGKRVVLLDDVISTGETLAALEQLAERAGATVVAKMAVFAEGDAVKRSDITCLASLPIFTKAQYPEYFE